MISLSKAYQIYYHRTQTTDLFSPVFIVITFKVVNLSTFIRFFFLVKVFNYYDTYIEYIKNTP